MRRGLCLRVAVWRCVERPRHSWKWTRGNGGIASPVAMLAARPLLRPPESEGGTIEVCADSQLDLDLPCVPTISVIGPSRRGKSVLACLLAGGNPGLFKQSHSSFKAMTSGTHVCEVPIPSSGMPLRIVDTEGLSHIGRSRKSEALVRQLLISTYLTSSWMIWLDTEVLSTSFFNMMLLVHDYVVDVLQIKEASALRLPGLIYVRTQESDVQQLEYRDQFTDFGKFFSHVLKEHEDADILTSMFAPDRILGHSLPVWTVDDLAKFESAEFWDETHDSKFKDAVSNLCGVLSAPLEETFVESSGPPLLALGALSRHLPKISRLEKFDPRDHEATKVGRLRAQLRGAYGSPVRSPLWLADLFDPEDKDVQQHAFRIDTLAKARIEKMCEDLRLEVDVAEADPEVIEVLERFGEANEIFSAALEAFANSNFSEKEILLYIIGTLHLDTSTLAETLRVALANAEEQFLSASGLPRSSLKDLRIHQRLKWQIEDCIQQMRGRTASELHLPRPGGTKREFDLAPVWRLGEWRLAQKRGPASRVHRPEYALWTDGTSWKLYEEKWLSQRDGDGFAIGQLFDEGQLEEGRLPLPSEASTSGPIAAPAAESDRTGSSGFFV